MASQQIGIDVGGTYTDAVLICDQKVAQKGKIPTIQEDLLSTILNALDYLDLANLKDLEYLTVSTTLVTNAILQKHLPTVELILFPGSGMNLKALPWPVPYRVLAGELDYRGRAVLSPHKQEWEELAEGLRRSYLQRNTDGSDQPLVAIVSKFSHRNNSMEIELAEYLRKEVPGIIIALGSEWGQSNFYRRSLTAYLNLAAKDLATGFSSQLQQAVSARGCRAPIRVLKADGGVLPLTKIRPVESIYSGPAASVLGAMAQNDADQSYIVVDIGGTTTDIGLVLSGSPLMSSRGAKIDSFLTNVRSLAVRSIPVGGDSAVLSDQGRIDLAAYRLGPATCLGGNHPTPTDALRFLDLIDIGDFRRAEQAIANLLPEGQRELPAMRETAQDIISRMAEKISTAIEELLQEWKDEPAYKVWEVLHQHEDINFSLQLSGGGALGIASALEQRMKMKAYYTDLSPVSNAIGAAMAKPTFSWTLNLDTNMGRYRIEETGEQEEWKGSIKPHREVEQFLRELAEKQARNMGIADSLQLEPFDYFPIIEGYRTSGQIVRGSLHVPPGAGSVKHE